ncbi:ABC transporter permease [uncultured Fretibacterium sp.]|uniref:ABC transporter permease n=1 Tax=uncultured Fretibacterium sp. TaxID=1678694 RepID=UPI00260278A9|nr:ABC transporter permease [uncultured Fretibacterium sp.]
MRKGAAPIVLRLLPWLLPAVLLAAWGLAGATGWMPGYLLPDPGRIAGSFSLYLFGQAGSAPYAGRFSIDAAASLARVSMGFAAAVLLGVPLGVLSGRSPTVQSLLGTTIDGVRAVPGISWLPLAMSWFGIGLGTTVFLIALAAFFPIYLNTASGVRCVDPILSQAGAMMGVGPLRSVWTILMPAAMPQILAGLRLGLGTSWAYLVLGELTGVPNGLGAVIMDARMLGRVDIIIVGIVVIAVMGRVSDLLLTASMRACFRSARRLT